jgi:tRNA(Arg) A34 adenosine deaminase TadA
MKHLQTAIKHVQLSDPQLVTYLAAVIVKGGKVVSIGRNKPKLNLFTVYNAHHKNIVSTHAEIDAILRVRKKINLRGADMYVARVKRTGGCGLAAPCEMCRKAIQQYGIRRVFYTDEQEGYGLLRF